MREALRLPVDDLLQRVRAEYRATPDLKLTPSQAIRLFDIEPAVCAMMLEALVKECFLSRTAKGLFRRITSSRPD